MHMQDIFINILTLYFIYVFSFSVTTAFVCNFVDFYHMLSRPRSARFDFSESQAATYSATTKTNAWLFRLIDWNETCMLEGITGT